MKGISKLTEVYQQAISDVSEVKQFTEEMLEYIEKKSGDVTSDISLSDEDRQSMRVLVGALEAAIVSAKKGKVARVRVALTPAAEAFTIGATRTIKQRSLISKMVLVHLISLWEAFIRDYASELLVAHPVMLRSKAQITFEELSSYDSIKQLNRGLADREVNTFSHQGIEDVAEFFAKRMNIDLTTFPEWDALRENSYRRNTVSHNGARIDGTYQRKLRGLKIKDVPVLDEAYVNLAAARILKFQKFLHAAVKRKFG
jgi:hypothetical protein